MDKEITQSNETKQETTQNKACSGAYSNSLALVQTLDLTVFRVGVMGTVGYEAEGTIRKMN